MLFVWKSFCFAFWKGHFHWLCNSSLALRTCCSIVFWLPLLMSLWEAYYYSYIVIALHTQCLIFHWFHFRSLVFSNVIMMYMFCEHVFILLMTYWASYNGGLTVFIRFEMFWSWLCLCSYPLSQHTYLVSDFFFSLWCFSSVCFSLDKIYSCIFKFINLLLIIPPSKILSFEIVFFISRILIRLLLKFSTSLLVMAMLFYIFERICNSPFKVLVC